MLQIGGAGGVVRVDEGREDGVVVEVAEVVGCGSNGFVMRGGGGEVVFVLGGGRFVVEGVGHDDEVLGLDFVDDGVEADAFWGGGGGGGWW